MSRPGGRLFKLGFTGMHYISPERIAEHMGVLDSVRKLKMYLDCRVLILMLLHMPVINFNIRFLVISL